MNIGNHINSEATYTFFVYLVKRGPLEDIRKAQSEMNYNNRISMNS